MAADPPASAPAPQPAAATTPPRGPRSRRGLLRLAALLLLVAAVAAAVWFLVLDDDDEDGQARRPAGEIAAAIRDGEVLAGPADAPFRLRHPDSWERLDGDALGETDPRPLAGLRREDATAIITVSARGPVRGGVSRLRETLPRELAGRFDDFRLVSSRVVTVAAGRALYTSWIREETGRVQSNLVVSEGNRRSYSVDAVIQGNATEAAQEVGAILRTFDVAR